MDVELGLLTDEIILQAPTKEKPYTIRDGRGLFVLVHPNGSRYFQMRATVAGKRKLMQLGVYPQITIAEARAFSAERLQAELDEAERGMPMGTHDEPGSLFMGDTHEMQVPRIVEQLKIEEKLTMMIDENEMDLFEDKLRVATPKVSLSYDQLVYIPSTLPKTFSQKFAARFHPKVLINQLIESFKQKLNAFKVILLALVQRGLVWVKESLRFCHGKLKMFIFHLLIKLENLLNGIKIAFQKFKTKGLESVLKKSPPLFVNDVVSDQVKHAPTTDQLSLVNHQALIVLAAPRKIMNAFLMNCQSVYGQLQNKSAHHLNTLRSIIQDERAVDRRDVISLYGLFAEAKGNYLIYTIKSIMAAVLIKKG
jgi:hypothetical protein